MRVKNQKKVTNQILTPEDVSWIKYLLNEGFSDRSLGRMWGVSRTEIYWIKTNKRWWDVKPREYADR